MTPSLTNYYVFNDKTGIQTANRNQSTSNLKLIIAEIRINELVYQLYGLKEEEIKIVEG